MKLKRKYKKIKVKPRNDLKDGIVIGTLITVILALACFTIVVFYQDKYEGSLSELSFEDKEDIIKNCENLSIVESAKCVELQVRKIYNYNLSNVGIILNFTELVNVGGVCSHYADLYCTIGEKLGFYTEDVVIDTGYGTSSKSDRRVKKAHKFCVWSNDDAYVILDQTKTFEFKFA